MTTKFEIVTAHIHHLRNVVLAEEVVVGCLIFELSMDIVRRVSENEVNLQFNATAALP